MAPSIERIFSKSDACIKEIQKKQALERLREEQIERNKRIPLELEYLNEQKKKIAKWVEEIFTRIDISEEKITPLEKDLLSLHRTLREINEGSETNEELDTRDAYGFRSLKLAEKDDSNSFYFGCIFAYKEFEALYPNLCAVYKYDMKNPICEEIPYWEEITDVEDWLPVDGEIQVFKEIYAEEGSRRLTREFVILSIPLSKESAIGMAVKEISEQTKFLD